MGFGGGGSGSFVLPNHTHTAVLQDGGVLGGASSLVDAETLDAWFVSEFAKSMALESVGKMSLIETYTEASATGTNKVFENIVYHSENDACLILDCTFTPSAGTALTCVISNTTGASYFFNALRYNSASVTHYTGSSATTATLAPSVAFVSYDSVRVKTMFSLEDGSVTRNITWNSEFNQSAGVMGFLGGYYNANTFPTTIDELDVSGAWRLGSSMSLYRVKRA